MRPGAGQRGPGQGVARLQKVPSLVWVWEEAGRLHPPQQVDRDNNVVAAGTTTSSLDNYTNAGVNDVFLMSLEALLQYFLAVGVVPPAGGFMTPLSKLEKMKLKAKLVFAPTLQPSDSSEAKKVGLAGLATCS